MHKNKNLTKCQKLKQTKKDLICFAILIQYVSVATTNTVLYNTIMW